MNDLRIRRNVMTMIKDLFHVFLGLTKGENMRITPKQWEVIKYHRLDLLAMSYLDMQKLLSEEEYLSLLNKKNETVKINTNLIHEMKKIHEAFKREHIDYVILKGVSLALNVYPKLYQRYFDDADILVDYDSLDKVTDILHEFGYIQGEFEDGQIVPASRKDILYQKLHTHEIYQMVKLQDGMLYEVDINFLFSWNGFERKTDEMYLPSFRQYIKEGNEGLPVFCNEIQLIHLCTHIYNEAMLFPLDPQYDSSEDSEELLLHRVYDVILLIQTDLDVELIYQTAKQKNCIEKVEYVSALIRTIAGESMVQKFSSYFHVNQEFPNYFYLKSGEKVEWPITLSERLMDFDAKQKALQELRERGVL